MPGLSHSSTPDSAVCQGAPWEAEGDGSSAWVAATHKGDPLGNSVPGFGPALTVQGT